jgi:hypothetical protein
MVTYEAAVHQHVAAAVESATTGVDLHRMWVAIAAVIIIHDLVELLPHTAHQIYGALPCGTVDTLAVHRLQDPDRTQKLMTAVATRLNLMDVDPWGPEVPGIYLSIHFTRPLTVNQ